MAEPTDTYPAEATNGTQLREGSEGEAALREVLDEHGEDLAVALEQTDEVVDLLETTILMIATADEEEIEYLTDSSTNLITAAEGISTAEAAEFAADVGENADDIAHALETILELQRDGHLEDLVELASMLSMLEIDAETVRGLNDVLGAMGEAGRTSKPVGIVGILRKLWSPDARAGLGYLVALLKALGRRLRQP